MYKVVFEYEDGTIDELFTDDMAEAFEYEEDEDFAYIEIIK